MINLQNFFIFLITILVILPSSISPKPINCNRSCPGGQLDPLPYPFGFSSGCEIQLNCTLNGSVLIDEFPVQEIHSDGLLVRLPATCGRRVQALTHLYGDHYAPTSTNAIILENCTEQMKNCMIPATMLNTHLESVNCSGGEVGYGNVSCYSSDVTRMFLDYKNVTKMGCRFLLTGVATERIGDRPEVSLDIQMVKLGWWLNGTCDCSSDADCIQIVSPVDASDGYRCKCKSGFEGDGYKASSGCRKLKGARKSYNANTISVGESDFLEWTYKQVETEGSLGDFGVTTKEKEELAKKMVIVSLWSILSDPSDRPSISKVLEMLEGSFQSLKVPP